MTMKSKKITTFPKAGRESNNVTTNTLIYFNEFMDLKGRIILITLIAEKRAETKNDITPVTTTTKSIKFQPSRK